MKLFTSALLVLSSFVADAFTSLPSQKTAFSRGASLKMSEDGMKLDPSKTALVLVEYQNEFTTEGGKLYDAVKDCMDTKNTLENSKRLLDAARAVGCTVIHLPIAFDKV